MSHLIYRICKLRAYLYSIHSTHYTFGLGSFLSSILWTLAPLHHLAYLSYLIESSKQIVQGLHQIAGRQGTWKGREVDNIREQNGDIRVPLDVELMEPGGRSGRLSSGSLTGIRHFQHDAAFHLRKTNMLQNCYYFYITYTPQWHENTLGT